MDWGNSVSMSITAGFSNFFAVKLFSPNNPLDNEFISTPALIWHLQLIDHPDILTQVQ